MTSLHIPGEVKFVTGFQAIRSPRWPFGRDTSYKMSARADSQSTSHIQAPARSIQSPKSTASTPIQATSKVGAKVEA